jgi:long-chain acyl-CoA synthetase
MGTSADMTIRTYFDRTVEGHPQRIAIQYRQQDQIISRTYAEMARRVRAVAELAHELGLAPRTAPVAVILENSPEWMEIYLAHAGCGITVVPIDPKLRPSEVAYILKDSGAAAVYTDRRHIPLLQEILPELPALRQIVLLDGTADKAETCADRPCHAFVPRVEALGGQAEKPDGFYRQQVARPADIASIIYTSGTTGVPKGAMLTHANFCADAEGALQLITHITGEDRFMIVLPLFHSFSFTANFVAPLCIGARMQFVTNLRSVGEDLKRYSPTVLMGVPLLVEKVYAKIIKNIRRSPLAQFLIFIGLRSLVARGVRRNLGGALRLIVVGGAPCSKKVLIGMRKFGLPIIEGYGLTEAAPIVSITKIDNVRPGTIGVPLPNIEVRIADADANGVGELQIRGPTVTQGYLNKPEATAEAFDGDWLRTGDLASQDADGHLTIRGRKKALIVNREGKNIYPEEVEVCIARDRRILDILVIGYHEKGEVGEKVGAIVVPNLENFKSVDADNPDWEEIEKRTQAIVRKQCQKLADYKHPRKIEVRREPLERTSIQKIRRHIYEGQLDSLAPASADDADDSL